MGPTNVKSLYPCLLKWRDLKISKVGLSFLDHRPLIFSILNILSVAGKSASLTASISEFNSTHVDITVSWESPGDPVTDGYVIYYQPKGGPVISDSVFGGETDTHSLDGLQRGVTYYISLVALSPHLPSPLVGPITVYVQPITVIPGESLASPFGEKKAVLWLLSMCNQFPVSVKPIESQLFLTHFSSSNY